MLLLMLDKIFISMTLRAGPMGRWLPWRLRRRIWGLAAATHEAFLKITQQLGWVAHDPNIVREAQSCSPKAIPRYPSGSLTLDKVSDRANDIVRGVCVLDNGTAIDVNALSWREDPFGGRPSMSRFIYHSFEWVSELIQAFKLTQREEYLHQAKEMTKKWISECLYLERLGRNWDDHVTALRAIALCQLWEALRGYESDGSSFMTDLFAAIVRHAEKLANELFDRPDHNHGVTQAYALMAIGLLYPIYPNAQRWKEIGRSRLEAQMSKNVSTEGIHREHSPYYHFYVFRQFFYAYHFAAAYGVSFSKGFTDRLQAMLSSGAHLLKPNGTLPALGDTSVTSPVLVEKSEKEEWPIEAAKNFLYSSTHGVEGTPPLAPSVVYPEGGYAFLRSGWGTEESFQEERFLAFRLSTIKSSHIHRDVFSFELYAYGDDLIVDSGGPFAYGHPLREFFLSTAAHNTVVADRQDQQVGEAQLLHWSTGDEYDLLDGEHRNYPGIDHRRVIIFVRPQYFIILDQLVSGSSHHYSQLFHLNPILQVILNGHAVSTVNPARGPTVKIIPLLRENLGVSLQRGTFTPRQGWVCTGDRQVVPNTVVDYQYGGTKGVFAVLIMPEPPGRSIKLRAQIEGTLFQDDTIIRVNFDDTHDEIHITPKMEVTIQRKLGDL